MKGEVFLLCGDKKQKELELFLIEDPRKKPIIYPIAEGSKLYSFVHDGDLCFPTMTKVSDEMRVLAFTEDEECIYVHCLEKDKLLLKV